MPLGISAIPRLDPRFCKSITNEHDDFGLRVSLVSALGLCQYAPAIPTLIAALSSPHEQSAPSGNLGTQTSSSPGGNRNPYRRHWHKRPIRSLDKQYKQPFKQFEHPSTYEEKIDRLIAQLRNAETTDEREATAAALGDLDKRVLHPLARTAA